MLISFKVANFLSFNEEVEFSMVAGQQRQPSSHVINFGEGRSRVGVLKSAIIYGANSSGKSNLLKAIDFTKKIIVGGIDTVPSKGKYFRYDAENKDKPSKFEFELSIQEKMYAYGFSLNLENKKIKSEWLVELTKTTDKLIFERTVNDDGTSTFKDNLKLTGKEKTRFTIYQEDVKDNQLFLTELQNKNSYFPGLEIFKDTYFVFKELIRVIFPLDVFNTIRLVELLNSDWDYVLNILNMFNTHISEIKEIEQDLGADFMSKIPDKEVLSKVIQGDTGEVTLNGNDHLVYKKGDQIKVLSPNISKLNKDNKKATFGFDEISDGDRRLLDFIPVLQHLLKNEGYVVFIDEIDRSFHPELTRKFMELYYLISENVKSQLIVTTHEASLLDLDLVRRDEIWFTEKNAKEESQLYSLEEFKPRHDKELRKAYLLGRYGAIPFISNVKLLGWLKDNSETLKHTTPSL